ncbi:unnamed protein product [Closterium sp. NIES-53]
MSAAVETGREQQWRQGESSSGFNIGRLKHLPLPPPSLPSASSAAALNVTAALSAAAAALGTARVAGRAGGQSGERHQSGWLKHLPLPPPHVPSAAAAAALNATVALSAAAASAAAPAAALDATSAFIAAAASSAADAAAAAAASLGATRAVALNTAHAAVNRLLTAHRNPRSSTGGHLLREIIGPSATVLNPSATVRRPSPAAAAEQARGAQAEAVTWGKPAGQGEPVGGRLPGARTAAAAQGKYTGAGKDGAMRAEAVGEPDSSERAEAAVEGLGKEYAESGRAAAASTGQGKPLPRRPAASVGERGNLEVAACASAVAAGDVSKDRYSSGACNVRDANDVTMAEAEDGSAARLGTHGRDRAARAHSRSMWMTALDRMADQPWGCSSR